MARDVVYCGNCGNSMFLHKKPYPSSPSQYECFGCYYTLESDQRDFREMVKRGRFKHHEVLQQRLNAIQAKLGTELSEQEREHWQNELCDTEKQLSRFKGEESIRLFSGTFLKTSDEIADMTPFGKEILEGFFEAREEYLERVQISQVADSGDL